jgi:hypothetical protein
MESIINILKIIYAALILYISLLILRMLLFLNKNLNTSNLLFSLLSKLFYQ